MLFSNFAISMKQMLQPLGCFCLITRHRQIGSDLGMQCIVDLYSSSGMEPLTACLLLLTSSASHAHARAFHFHRGPMPSTGQPTLVSHPPQASTTASWPAPVQLRAVAPLQAACHSLYSLEVCAVMPLRVMTASMLPCGSLVATYTSSLKEELTGAQGRK